MVESPANERELSGRVALVTGASRRRGIGAAVARALAARGADVAFSHWRPYDAAFPWAGEASEPDDLEAELRQLGARAAAIVSDLSVADAPARLLDEVEALLGPVSILVNNAAHSTNDGYERLDAATIDAHYAVNTRATMLLSVELARRFSFGSGGRIVNLTTGQALGPMPDEFAYAATEGRSRPSPAVSPWPSRRSASPSTRSTRGRLIPAGSRRRCATRCCRNSPWGASARRRTRPGSSLGSPAPRRRG